ncbi:membrane metallo-endopeptidase-like 1 isoform X2 [Pollicipes pollicipes]|nr:membrane metallo-endopeptidase-like 1 isoform X2 [Pollicipes pollicipes]
MEFFKEYIHAGNHSSEFNSTDVDDMKNFLSSMAMITPSHREKVEMEIHGEQVYVNPMTVDDLESEYTFVNWTVLLSEALSANVSSSDIVYVPFPGYLDDLDMKIELLPAHTIHNGLLLMYRMDYLSAMADMLAPAPATQLKDMCLDLTKDMYPVPVAGMFVRDAGRGRLQQLKDEVSVLLNDIKTVLTTSIERKAAAEPSPVYSMALRKLRSLRSLLVASPSFWSDEFIAQNTPTLPSLAPAVDHDQPDRHKVLRLIRAMQAVRNFSIRKYQEVDTVSENYIWSQVSEPYELNAFYFPDGNTVVVPLAFLSEPYFYDAVPQYVKYATLGHVLSHELLHGLGVTGFQYDDSGRLRQLTEAERRQLAELRSCVRHNFVNNLTKIVHIQDIAISAEPDGELTLDENLSDHDALPLTWRAYQRWHHQHGSEPALPGVNLTLQQTFLLAWGQIYCAKLTQGTYIASVETDAHLNNPERVNAMMRHWPEFASSFHCAEGSPMRPSVQCRPLW